MPLQVIPWSPPCLFCVSGIHRERNYGATRSTRPITVHERTAIWKSQLEPFIENPGNTRGAEQAFGRWFADGLYQGLVSSATQARGSNNHLKELIHSLRILRSLG